VSEEEVKGVIRAIYGAIMEKTLFYYAEDATAVYPYDMLAHVKLVCFDGADCQSTARRRRILV